MCLCVCVSVCLSVCLCVCVCVCVDLLGEQVSSRIEIGLLDMKGEEKGYGVGALMLPEAFVQKVKAQRR